MTDTSADTVDPFVQLWDDIKTEATKIEAELKAIASTLETDAVADIEAIFKVGAPLAVQAIASQAAALISGTEKFGAVVTSVMQQLEAILGPVLIQDVQALVQIAFRGVQQVANGD